jgi:hypothetical protein
MIVRWNNHDHPATLPNCGKEREIFSDEFDKKHICKGCGKEIDFTQCTLDGEA